MVVKTQLSHTLLDEMYEIWNSYLDDPPDTA